LSSKLHLEAEEEMRRGSRMLEQVRKDSEVRSAVGFWNLGLGLCFLGFGSEVEQNPHQKYLEAGE
jgi:hypothetical protein